jgi:hypothetical protein
VWGVYPVEGYHYTHWLTGLWSTQPKVEGIVLKAAWHWSSDSSVINDPLGEQDRTPLHVGLLSTWDSVDDDLIFLPILEKGSFFGESSRHSYKCLMFSCAHIKVPVHTKKSIFGFLFRTQRKLRFKSGVHLELC